MHFKECISLAPRQTAAAMPKTVSCIILHYETPIVNTGHESSINVLERGKAPCY